MSAFFLSSIVAAISAAGYGGVIGLMAVESACIPLPSEIIMPFSGFLVSTGRFDLFMVATAGAIGCNVGSTAAYLLGSYGGRKAVLRWGHYVFFGAGEVDRLDSFFNRYGSTAVLIGRLLPVVRTFISFPAGVAKMSFVRFQIYTFIGSWPWCFALAYVGMILGNQWKNSPTLQAVFHRLDWAIAAAMMAAVAYYIYDRWRSIRKRD